MIRKTCKSKLQWCPILVTGNHSGILAVFPLSRPLAVAKRQRTRATDQTPCFWASFYPATLSVVARIRSFLPPWSLPPFPSLHLWNATKNPSPERNPSFFIPFLEIGEAKTTRRRERWTTPMCRGRSSRWSGSSGRRPRRKLMRSPSPPKRFYLPEISEVIAFSRFDLIFRFRRCF